MTEPATPTSPPSNRSALLIVFLVVFIDLLGFGIVLPLLPQIGRDVISPVLNAVAGEGHAKWLDGLLIGLLMASFSLMQFFFSPQWGRLSDRIGRRPVLLVGLVGSVLFYGLFGYACSLDVATMGTLVLTLFFVARIGQGVSGATIATAQAVIADCTPPEKRKHGMALIGAAFGIGFTFGPLIAYASLGFFDSHPEAIGYTAAAISGIALILGFFVLPETRRFSDAPPLERRILNATAMHYALTSPRLAPVILVFFLTTFGFAGFEVTLALLLKEVLKLADDKNRELLLYFAYVGFVLMLTQGFLYRRAAKKLSEVVLMAIGIVFMGGGVAGLGGVTLLHANGVVITPMHPALIAALTSAVVGFAFLNPSASALISRRTSAEHQGEVLGVNQSASSLARILGPLVFMPLFTASENHLLPYAIGGALLLLMLPILPVIRRNE